MENHELKKGMPVTPAHDEDIVSIILAERKEREQENGPAQVQTSIITDDTFFIDNNPMGCLYKQQFIQTILGGLTEPQLKEYQLFLQKLSNGERLNFKPLSWGKGEIKWYYATFSYRKGDQQYKIPAIGQTDVFLVLYQMELINCNISLEGLCKVAHS